MCATRKLALLRSEMTARSIQKAVASLFIPQRKELRVRETCGL